MIRPVRRILKRICSTIIQKRIESGEVVYFESPLEELAFKYLPGKNGDQGRYFAKYYRQEEFEINSDSSSVDLAINEGFLITRHRYEIYHLIEGVHWNRGVRTPWNWKQAGT